MSRANGHGAKSNGRGPAALPPEAFDAAPRLQLTFTDEAVYLMRFHLGRPALPEPIPVALADVAQALRDFGADTGLLPADTLFWQSGRQGLRLGVWLPPARRTLLFDAGRERDKRLDVPLPGLVFVGRGTQYWVFACPQRPARKTDRLYRAPLPNVNPDGLICAGSVKFPRCAPDTLAQAVSLFFESGFNHDLSQGKVRAKGSLLNFLRGLKAAEQFPADQLLPLGASVGDLLRGGVRPGSLAGDDETDEEPDPEWGDGDEARFDDETWVNEEPEGEIA